MSPAAPTTRPRFRTPFSHWSGPVLAVLIAAIGLSGRAAAQEIDGLAAAIALEQAFVRVIEECETSVVSIARVRSTPAGARRDVFNPFDGGPDRPRDLDNPDHPGHPDFVPNEFGSGVIIASPEDRTARLILTNYHVVKGGPTVKELQARNGDQLYVRFSDGRGASAGILAADPRSDLAVLQIDETGNSPRLNDWKPLPLTAAEDFRKGQLVVALGNPYAIGRDGAASASWGMISNIARRPTPPGPLTDEEARRKETIHHFGTLLTTDTRLNLGTSGGALINLRGELIGLTTSLAALEGYEKSVGYAIPMDQATRRIIGDLARGWEVEYGFLGVTPTDVAAAELRQIPGIAQVSAARAIKVFSNSPAATAGLREGDIILEIDGHPVRGRMDLMRIVGELPPEKEVPIRLWRDTDRRFRSITVELGKWPVYDDEGIIATVDRHKPWRGLRVDYPTGRRKFLQYPFRYPEAVVVTAVDAGRRQLTEVQPGDFITRVDGRPVGTPAEFSAAVRNKRGPVSLQLHDGRTVSLRE